MPYPYSWIYLNDSLIAGYNTITGDYRTYRRYVIPLLHMTWNAEHSHIFAVKAAKAGIVPRIRGDDPEVRQFLVRLNNQNGFFLLPRS